MIAQLDTRTRESESINPHIGPGKVQMSMPRDTYKYHFKLGNRIVHSGITNDLERREAEHRRQPGWEKGHILQVGRRTTREGALRWEDEQRRKGKPTGP